jgi:tetratricopeptide (TPR) repeat protein
MQWLAKSLLVGKFRGTEIRFHFSMLFTLVFAYFIFRPTDLWGVLIATLWLVGIFVCVLLHEMGHALAAQLLGVEVKNIVIWPLGGFTTLSRKPEKPFHSLLVSGSGPLINIAIMVLLGTLYFWLSLTLPSSILGQARFPWVDQFMSLVSTLAFLNLVLVVFNLLPIYPLDGGEMMRSVLEMILGKPSADLITMIVSIPVLLCLVTLGVFTRDYILLFFCILIALAIGTLNRRTLHWINLGVNYLFRRVGYHYLQGDYDPVIRYFTREIEREPSKAQHYIARATAYLNILRKEMARADLERALKLEPDNVVAIQILGEVHGMDKDYETALHHSERALQLKPNWAIPYFDRGAVYLELKDYQTALENFNKTIALMPQMPIFYLLRSMVHFRLDDLESAHQDQAQALRLSRKEALTMADVNLPVYEGYLDWAEDYYGRVISGNTNLSLAYQGRADAFRVNGKYEQAISDYTHAIELSPREARLYIGRGKANQARGELTRAGEDFRKAKEVTDKSHQKRQAEECLKELG